MLLTDTSLTTSSSSRNFSSLLKRGTSLVCAVALAFGLIGADTASAQKGRITAKALIGNSVSNPDDPRYSDVAEAIKRFENRDQLSARTFLERAIQKNDKLPPAGILIAKMHLLAGNSSAIRPALEQAVQEDSANDPEPYLLLAEEALVNNRTIEAEALFAKTASMIDGYSKNAKRKRRFVIRTNRGLAVIAERREKWEEALGHLEVWLQQDPDDASALNSKGQILFMLNKPTDGYNAFVASKKKDDSLRSPYVSSALMYSKLGKDKESMQAFERAFAEAKADERTMSAYSQALIKSGNLKKSLSVLKKAHTSLPKSLDLWLLSGVANRMSNNLPAAESDFLRGLSLVPSNRDVLNQLAQILILSPDEADQKRALAFAQMNAQLNPKNADVNITFAWALFKNGYVPQANAALQKAVRNGSLSSDGQYLLAQMLMVNNQTDNAKKLLQAALSNTTGIFVEEAAAKKLLGTL